MVSMEPIKINSIIDLVRKFPDEKSCHQYIASQRWFDGEITCPHEGCSCTSHYVFKDGKRYKCKMCERIFTAKTGTFMEASKLPTIKWLMAMFLLMNKKGISSIQLSKSINVTQTTAWFMLQRMRGACHKDMSEKKLSGTIEIDETFVGGRNINRHYSKKIKYQEETGRKWPDKIPVFGMYERGTGKLKATVIEKQTLDNIHLAVLQHVNTYSTLMTDDWKGYGALDYLYTRQSVEHGRGQYANGDITTNRIENFWSHFKRGMNSTYIRVEKKHLDKYVQEFVFRFNYRKLPVQEQLNGIIRNMECRLKYKDLIAA